MGVREPKDIWQSSRMMLPEHARSLSRWAEGLGLTPLPEVDEQQRASIERSLIQAHVEGRTLVFVVHTPRGAARIASRIARLDGRRGVIVLASGRTIPFAHILDVEETLFGSRGGS